MFFNQSIVTRFDQENTEETALCLRSGSNLIRKRPMAELPDILRKYLLNCGYTGDEAFFCASIKWSDANLSMSPGKGWVPLACEQANYFPEPVRLAKMNTRIAGLIPFTAMDKYRRGTGNLIIKIFKWFTVSNDKGKEMDQAELVTILAETIFLPIYALQRYITWRSIDRITVEGTIEDHGIKAKGLFYFTEEGRFLRFETNDRYYAVKGQYIPYKWTAVADNIKTITGYKIPADFKAIWSLPSGDYPYFKGSIEDIKFSPLFPPDTNI